MRRKSILSPLSLLLCAALALSILLTGCSEGTTPPASSEAPAQSAAAESTAQPEATDSTAAPEATSSAQSAAPAGTAAELGSLKAFTADTLDGGSFTQDDIFAKDLTIINFWALSCPPCIGEMPDLADFAKKLPDNVQIITMCLDALYDEESTKSILSEAGFEGVTLVSGEGDLSDVCYQLQYTPTTVLVDSQGNLVGDAIIGTCEDLSETYLTAINSALKAGGKAEIRLAS